MKDELVEQSSEKKNFLPPLINELSPIKSVKPIGDLISLKFLRTRLPSDVKITSPKYSYKTAILDSLNSHAKVRQSTKTIVSGSKEIDTVTKLR